MPLPLGVPHEDQTTKLLHMCRGPRSVPCRVPGWWFSLCGQVSWFCRFSCGAILVWFYHNNRKELESSDYKVWFHLCLIDDDSPPHTQTHCWNSSIFSLIPVLALFVPLSLIQYIWTFSYPTFNSPYCQWLVTEQNLKLFKIREPSLNSTTQPTELLVLYQQH